MWAITLFPRGVEQVIPQGLALFLLYFPFVFPVGMTRPGLLLGRSPWTPISEAIHIAHLDKPRPVLGLARDLVIPHRTQVTVAPVTSYGARPVRRDPGRASQRTRT